MFGRAVVSHKLKSTSAASIFLCLDLGKCRSRVVVFLDGCGSWGRTPPKCASENICRGLDLHAPISLSFLIQPTRPSYLQADVLQYKLSFHLSLTSLSSSPLGESKHFLCGVFYCGLLASVKLSLSRTERESSWDLE